MHLAMLLHYLIDHPPCFLILLQRPFDEDVPQVGVRNLFFCDLDSRTGFQLKRPDGVPALANNKADTLIRNWDDISLIIKVRGFVKIKRLRMEKGFTHLRVG